MDGSGYPQSSDDGGFDPPRDSTAADRRQSDRHRAVCRIARVRRVDDAGLWRVRNISDRGMMLAADVAMTVGERIEVALSESTVLTGTIVWVEKGRCGVAFADPIDAAATLRALAEEQNDERYRALRLPIEAEAIAALPGGARPMDLVNISQSGAGFLCDIAFEPGTAFDLLLPGDDLRRRALVRWSRGLRGGLWFTRPLDRADLESIARFRR